MMSRQTLLINQDPPAQEPEEAPGLINSPQLRQPLLINQEWNIQRNPYFTIFIYLNALKAEMYIWFFFTYPLSLKAGLWLDFPSAARELTVPWRPSLSPSVCPQGFTYWALEKGPRLLGRRKQLQLSTPFSFLLSPLTKRKNNTNQQLINALDLPKEN